jgi:hypothetical protein
MQPPPPPPPPPAATDATATRQQQPPPPPPLIFDLLFSTGSLDAVTLTALASCSRDLRRAVTDFWAGVRGHNAVAKLKSVVVVSGANNRRLLQPQPYSPVSEASLCVACHETTTRFLHPVHGQPLCPRCGSAAETAHCWSPLYEHRMMDEQQAKKRYCLDAAAPDARSGFPLRCGARRGPSLIRPVGGFQPPTGPMGPRLIQSMRLIMWPALKWRCFRLRGPLGVVAGKAAAAATRLVAARRAACF